MGSVSSGWVWTDVLLDSGLLISSSFGLTRDSDETDEAVFGDLRLLGTGLRRGDPSEWSDEFNRRSEWADDPDPVDSLRGDRIFGFKPIWSTSSRLRSWVWASSIMLSNCSICFRRVDSCCLSSFLRSYSVCFFNARRNCAAIRSRSFSWSRITFMRVSMSEWSKSVSLNE